MLSQLGLRQLHTQCMHGMRQCKQHVQSKPFAHRPCALTCRGARLAIFAALMLGCAGVAALAAVGVHGGAVINIGTQGARLLVAAEGVVVGAGAAQAGVGRVWRLAVFHLSVSALRGVRR